VIIRNRSTTVVGYLGAALVVCALAEAACGPNASGMCLNPTPETAVVAQGESAPQPETKDPAPVAVASTSADGGTAMLTTSDGGALAATDAAPAGPQATGGTFAIGGAVKSGSRPAKFAVVYLEDAPKDPSRGLSTSIDQRMMMFVPYVAAVAVGGTVNFVNSDPFPHNVFSPSGDKFDLGTLSKGGVGHHAFKTPGAYTLLCNVHPGMIGYIYVAPSSYFAVANAQGEFNIRAVPEGTYKIAAWLPKMGGPAKSVTVRGADAKVELEIDRQ